MEWFVQHLRKCRIQFIWDYKNDTTKAFDFGGQYSEVIEAAKQRLRCFWCVRDKRVFDMDSCSFGEGERVLIDNGEDHVLAVSKCIE